MPSRSQRQFSNFQRELNSFKPKHINYTSRESSLIFFLPIKKYPDWFENFPSPIVNIFARLHTQRATQKNHLISHLANKKIVSKERFICERKTASLNTSIDFILNIKEWNCQWGHIETFFSVCNCCPMCFSTRSNIIAYFAGSRKKKIPIQLVKWNS